MPFGVGRREGTSTSPDGDVGEFGVLSPDPLFGGGGGGGVSPPGPFVGGGTGAGGSVSWGSLAGGGSAGDGGEVEQLDGGCEPDDPPPVLKLHVRLDRSRPAIVRPTTRQ